MKHTRVPVAAALASLVAGVSVAVVMPLAAQGASGPNCAALADPISYRVNPSSSTGLLAPATDTARSGFSEDRGVMFRGSVKAEASLAQVHQLYKASSADYLFTYRSGEITKATASGYLDQGATFSVSTTSAACTVPVYRYLKKAHHQYAASSTARAALVAAGWSLEGVAFYAAAPAVNGGDNRPAPTPTPAPTPVEAKGDTKFTFAALPDTQQEVLNAKDPRFINRTKWLAANKSDLDLRWVTSSGDVVNWDTPDHSQYKIASAAMVPLEQAKIPYTLTIGNHDTQATDAPGGARDPKRTRILQRDTSTFNSYFSAEGYGDVAGAFEPGKVDNLYTSYTAGGVKWMVMTLELWPRASVVAWANQIVASHPNHNVIITTHHFIDGSGNLGQSASYGDTSPQALYDNFVKKHTNIKFVISGHVGRYGSKVHTGLNGNKIVSFNQTFHSNTTNPVRLLEVDTKAGTVTSKVYAPATGETIAAAATSHTGLTFVK